MPAALPVDLSTSGTDLSSTGPAKAAPSAGTQGLLRGGSSAVVVAVDGDSLARRAHHGLESTGWADRLGRPSWVVDGALQMTRDVVARIQRFAPVAALVVAFDDRGPSWRREMHPGYKAGRRSPGEVYFEQLPLLRDALARAGAAVLSHPGQEADDVVASVAAAARAEGRRSVVCTSDRDAFALIDHDVVIYRFGVRGNDAWVNSSRLRDRYGIDPGQYLDLAALRGDPADALDGVPGFGDKRAAQLLAAFGSVTEAFDSGVDAVAEVVGRRLAGELFGAREIVERNRVLMRTATNLAVRWPDPPGPVSEIDELGLSLRGRAAARVLHSRLRA